MTGREGVTVCLCCHGTQQLLLSAMTPHTHTRTHLFCCPEPHALQADLPYGRGAVAVGVWCGVVQQQKSNHLSWFCVA